MELTFSIVELINILIISAGIGVCGMCFLHISTSENLKQEKVFRRYFQLFFIFLILCITSHLVRQILDGQLGKGMHTFLSILPCLEGIFVSTLPYMMGLLLLSLARTKYKKRIEIGLHSLLFAQVIFIIITGALGLIYYYDDANVYHRGSLYLLSNLVPAIMIIIGIVAGYMLLQFQVRKGLIESKWWKILLLGLAEALIQLGITILMILLIKLAYGNEH